MKINWFPGHMKKATDTIREQLKLVDLTCEILDARIPRSSANEMLREVTKQKPRLSILNKVDMADEGMTRRWIEALRGENRRVIALDSLHERPVDRIVREASLLLKDELERRKEKGISKAEIRMMVFGIPNSGKSTFINNLAAKRSAKVGNRPGVTTQKQWIRTKSSLLLLDTPGVLWQRLSDEQGLHLAYTGAIRDEILELEDLGFSLIRDLLKSSPDAMKERYGLEDGIEPLAAMEEIARKSGAIRSGGEIDYRKAAQTVLDDFRKGRLGRITLESPDDALEAK